MSSFYSKKELIELGLGSCGSDVWISRKASIYHPEGLFLGNHIRIDDFCLISAGGGVRIGDYVHIGAFCALYGGSGIVMENFSGISPRTTLLSESDDFSGESMIHPFFPTDLKSGYLRGKITLCRYTQTGCGTTVFPGVTIETGSVTGAHTLVIKDLPPWGIFVGTPAKLQTSRSRRVVQLAKGFLKNQNQCFFT